MVRFGRLVNAFARGCSLFIFIVVEYSINLNLYLRDFPGGPVVKTSPANAGSASSIPGRGAKIPDALWPKKPKKHKTEAIL